MKRFLIFIGLGIALLSCLPTLHQRWFDEHHERRVALVVDWREVHDLANRAAPSTINLLQALHDAGVQGILFSPLTLKDAVRGREAALTQRTITFENARLGKQALDELTRRGVTELESDDNGDSFALHRPSDDFSALGDIEMGYDTRLLELCRDQGLAAFLRVNEDPWLQNPDPLPDGINGVIFTTDDPPGGPDAVPAWANLLRTQGWANLFVEFKPTRAAVAIARAFPGATLRTHTIPTPELKDMTPDQERARWERAVHERACRCLLFRPAPMESWPNFLMRLDILRRRLLQEGWTLAVPALHPQLTATPPKKLWLQLGIAFTVAACLPLVALVLARSRQGWTAYGTVIVVTLAGALMVASVAYLPETRWEIIPFRGIKAAILISWLGSFLLLYKDKELRQLALRPLTRLDLAAGLLLVAIVGYGIVRSGNAAPSLRAGSEQGIRDYLEKTLEVRPRFKEFAVGYPLLLLGFLLYRRRSGHKKSWDARPLIALGMIGPISTLNTFCHLHSPLALAFARSGLGILIGSFLGGALYMFYSFIEGGLV